MYSQDYDSDYSPSAPVLTVSVFTNANNAETITALVDTGADGTLIPADVLRRVKARYVAKQGMRGITGRVREIKQYRISVSIGPYTVHNVRAGEIEAGAEPIIGRDVLNQCIVTVNGLAGVTEVKDTL